MEHHDVIIIGTGAGGGTLAHRLAPTGKRILLLERGGYLPREPENWDAEEVFVNERYLSGEPGPGCEVAHWLAERGVALTGCDTWSYGPVPPEDPERPFEVPQILNVRHGVFVVENLDTAALAADGVRAFALVLTHARLRGATGAWTSPIALV